MELPLNQIIQGDSAEVLKQLPDNCVDSIVTDPPAGIGFMGKEWDSDKGGRDEWIKWLSSVMSEGLRTLKPGGHALVWALPRTSHWTALALEDAGFEIRDCVYHLFGSGFPKSLNIGKAVDKLQGNEREYIGKNPSARPNSEKYNTILSGAVSHPDITKGNSEWEGWGTALKPAVECWWLCRKPISEKSIAENVLKWGTGGINIDGSRIGTKDNLNGGIYSKGALVENPNGIYGERNKIPGAYKQPIGRFPSHLIHDGSDVILAQFPNTKSGKMNQHIEGGNFSVYAKQYPRDVETIGDEGSAARFFYCAKPSPSERNKGLEGFEEKQSRGGGQGKDNPELEKIAHAYGSIKAPAKNFHPTVKAQSLMQYLIKLITPPKGIVLDCFAGSGSTCLAAKNTGFKYIGIELDPEYCEIARKRVEGVVQHPLPLIA